MKISEARQVSMVQHKSNGKPYYIDDVGDEDGTYYAYCYEFKRGRIDYTRFYAIRPCHLDELRIYD